METTTFGTIRIDGLRGREFIIPYYQRGYKWRQDDVRLLVDDICDYTGSQPYYLQPLVVVQAGRPGRFLLVDGQQRLTTLYLILKTAQHKGLCPPQELYRFTCTAKSDSQDYLDRYPAPWTGGETCDIHYYEEARRYVEGLDDRRLQTFVRRLEENVEFIWYPLADDAEGPAHFERLNSCNIPLTNTELTKALLLQSARAEDRILRATEWNQMEYTLQDNRFFAFLCPLAGAYGEAPNRIELLLDIYTGNVGRRATDEDRRRSYKHIEQRLRERPDDVWPELVDLFHTLESWYRNPFCYNLIGFLAEVYSPKKVVELYAAARQAAGLRAFQLEVLRQVCLFVAAGKDDAGRTVPAKDRVAEAIETLTYKDEKTKNTLLLFNILQMMSTPLPPDRNPWREDSATRPDEYFRFNDRFHFELYKAERNGWDKEHVHATASESLTSADEWVEWMIDVAPALADLPGNAPDTPPADPGNEADGPTLEQAKTRILCFAQAVADAPDEDSRQALREAEKKKLSQAAFAGLYACIVTALDGYRPDDRESLDQNSIGNLALLNAGINRAYKAAPFSTKRRYIAERVKHGAFVPIATRNLFLKLYTARPAELYHWRKDPYPDGQPSDSRQYLDTMIATFRQIFPDPATPASPTDKPAQP